MRCSSTSSAIRRQPRGRVRSARQSAQACLGIGAIDRLEIRPREQVAQQRRRRVGAPLAGEDARVRQHAVELDVLDARRRARASTASRSRCRASARSPRRIAMRTSWFSAVASTSDKSPCRAPRRAVAGRRARPSSSRPLIAWLCARLASSAGRGSDRSCASHSASPSSRQSLRQCAIRPAPGRRRRGCSAPSRRAAIRPARAARAAIRASAARRAHGCRAPSRPARGCGSPARRRARRRSPRACRAACCSSRCASSLRPHCQQQVPSTLRQRTSATRLPAGRAKRMPWRALAAASSSRDSR